MKLFELINQARTVREVVRFDSTWQLNEVVLAVPVERALAGYVERAPSEETRKWLLTNFKNWLMKNPDNLFKLPYLPQGADERMQKAFSYQDLYDVRLTQQTQTMLTHIMDWFEQVPQPPRLERMAVPDVLQAANQYFDAMNKRAMKDAKDVEPEVNYRVVMEFPGGWRFVEANNEACLSREGALMGHCVGGYGQQIASGQTKIYSLRDGKNQPHATLEVRKGKTVQIKGKRNRAPVRKYWPMILAFLEHEKVQAEGDFENVGLIRMDDKFISLEQFADMVNDPNSEEGKAVHDRIEQRGVASLHSYADSGKIYGYFNAVYGTPKMTDDLIQLVFDKFPDQALGVVEHHGNRFTPEQTVLAFQSISPGHGGLADSMADLIRAVRPNAEVAEQIAAQLNNNAVNRYERGGRQDAFVVGMMKSYPSVYAEMIDHAGPDGIERELEGGGDRPAGPFMAFATRGQADRITDRIALAAFRLQPSDAMKAVLKNDLTLSVEAQVGAFVGISGQFGRHAEERSNPMKLMSAMIERFVLDKQHVIEVIDLVGKDAHHPEFIRQFVQMESEKNPQAVDQDVYDEMLLAVGEPDDFIAYLAKYPKPSWVIQQGVLKRIFPDEGDRHNYVSKKWLPVLRDMAVYDDRLWKLLLDRLKIPAVEPTVEKTRSVTRPRLDHNGNPVRDQRGNALHDYKSEPYTHTRTQGEMAGIYRERQRQAIDNFEPVIRAMLMKPLEDRNKFQGPDPTKLGVARSAFDQLGRPKLLDLFLQRIFRNDSRNFVTGNDYRSDPGQVERFKTQMGQMTPREIAKVITSAGYQRALFATLVDQRPESVPLVIAASGGLRGSGRVFGDMKQKGMTKDQVFKSLEAVWGSERLSDGIKDEYTTLVFKRFKPRLNQIVPMLQRADNADAVEYLLKKTKKPGPDLVKYVVDEFPNLILNRIPLEFLSDDDLRKLFANGDWKDIAARDLRGWGYTDDERRSKYKRRQYLSKIDRDSPEFQRYADAAQHAGKQKEFARWAREGELEDQHDQLMGRVEHPPGPGDRYPRVQNVVDQNLLRQHMDEWSNKTLIKAARHDDVEARMIIWDHFPVRRLADLVLQGLFIPENNWGDQPVRADYSKLGEKADQVIDLILDKATEEQFTHHQSGFPSFLKDCVKSGYVPDDSTLVKLIEKKLALTNEYSTSESVLDKLVYQSESPEVQQAIFARKDLNVPKIANPEQKIVDQYMDKYFMVEKKTKKADPDDPDSKEKSYYELDYWIWEALRTWYKRGERNGGFAQSPIRTKLYNAARRLGQPYVELLDLSFAAMSQRGPDSYMSAITVPDELAVQVKLDK